MAGYEVIADVSRTLQELLRKNLTPEPINEEELIGMCSPVEPGNYVLGFDVYDLEEKRDLGAQININLRPGIQKNPPTPLMLYYMFTVYSKAELVNRVLDEQRIIGRVIQVLNDHSMLKGDHLQGNLKGTDTELIIARVNLTMEEKVVIWSLYNQPYQLSVYYSVGPIYLESDITRDTRPVTEFRVDMEGKDND